MPVFTATETTGPSPCEAGGPSVRTIPLLPASGRGLRTAVGFDAQVLWRITAMAFRHRWRMAVAIVATVLAATAQIVIPQLIGAAIDRVQGLLGSAAAAETLTREGLATTAWLLLAAAVFRGVCTMMQNYLGEAVGHLIAHELRLRYYAQLQHLSHSYHDHVHTGDLMTRGILDIEGTRMWVSTGVLRLVLLGVLLSGGGWTLY
ncbi:MAG: ABC transporter transmembrane domain-containing protein, partial [Gammaproteobacteria bacterium]